jgi:hypothetical protein
LIIAVKLILFLSSLTVHDRFWNVGQANCILKYFENMMIDHSDAKMADFTGKIHASALH